MLRGFRNFLMQGELIVIAVGLVIALAFSTLILAFTSNIITPLVNAAGGGGAAGRVSAGPSMVSGSISARSSRRSSTSSFSWP